ncbi:uncharacterized protein LOC122059823 [Macadamia integrifolia]|uniref:uncharacterized protein LOC122059823 n=1 Tax=Macadamia integrifolia TaxID=60698 RepID=UPI001C4F2CDB|nr:uncharacterized protein LOC122059823 [Macadamia integrifolia]
MPMPKKRKGKKKKKGRPANSHSTTNSQQGNDGLKIYDGKDSDVGETSHLKSEPLHRQLGKGKEQEEVDSKGWESHPFSPFVILKLNRMETSQNGTGNGEVESKQMKVLEEEEEVVQDIEITRELKPEVLEESEVVEDIQPEEDSESKDANIESVERDAGSASCSRNFDEESRLEDNNSLVMESEKVEEEKSDSVMETVADVYSAGELVEEKSANSVMETVSDVELAGKLEEEEKSDGSVTEAAPAVDSAEPVVSLDEEVTQSSVSTSGVDAGVSNEIGLESKDKEEMPLPLSNETTPASDVNDSMETKIEDRMLQYSDAPIIETSGSGSAELPEEPVIPESSENQPLLGAISSPVERTSWKSCCGIFDVVRSSDR